MTLVEHPDGLAPSTPDDTVAGPTTETVSIGSREVWRLAWRVSQHRPREFWIGWALFVVFFTMPAVTGFMLARGFEALSDGDTSLTYWCAAAVAVSELIRMVAIHPGALIWTAAWIHMQTFLRANLLAAQMASGGSEAGRPIGVGRRGDHPLPRRHRRRRQLRRRLVDVSGGVVFTVFAGIVLGMADARAAAVLLLPLVGVAIATRTLDNRIKVYRAADREATAEVTGLVGDVMAAATTVKVNDAVDAAARTGCKVLVEARRADGGPRPGARRVRAGVQPGCRRRRSRARPARVSASAIASGAFGLGDLALFTAYLGWLSFLPRMIGRVLARRKQAGVAFDRMRRLVADEHAPNTATPETSPGRAAGRPRAPRRSSAPSAFRWSASTWSASRRSTTAAGEFATCRSRSSAASSWS